MNKTLSPICIFFVSILACCSSFAGGLPLDNEETIFYAPPATENPDHFELIGALGLAGLRSGTKLGVTSQEIDTLVNNNKWNTFAAQLGLGYVHYFRDSQRYSDQTQWFPSIEPQLNVYYLGGNTALKGDVWRHGLATANDMTYEASVHSVRLMFDAALTIISQKHFSIYAIGGIGNAWNRVGYEDYDNEGSPTNQRLNLNSHTSSNFVWEVGGGLNLAFNDRVGLSLEYLYADLGTAKSSASGTYGDIIRPQIVPADFKIKSHTVLLGLHIALERNKNR